MQKAGTTALPTFLRDHPVGSFSVAPRRRAIPKQVTRPLESDASLPAMSVEDRRYPLYAKAETGRLIGRDLVSGTG